jgi:hypothetical protein
LQPVLRFYRHLMTVNLSLPDGPLADASLAAARERTSESIVNHSIRSFWFARLLAEDENAVNDADYDEDLLFAATVMHDLGLSEEAPAEARFEVEGADMAVPVLTLHGVTEEDVDRVWEAIALHATMGIASRRGLLTHLTHVGVMIEIGRADALPAELVRAVHEALPRDPNDTSVRDAIIRHASRSEAARPPFSISAELHRLSSSSRDGFVDGP